MVNPVIPEGEHGHAHGHGTGIRWLDLLIAGSAMFISVVSLAVSIEHGRIMERMADQNEKVIAANNTPLLNLDGSDIDPATGKGRLSLNLRNGGVGPAMIRWLTLRYDGVSLRGAGALLRSAGVTDMPPGRLPQGVYYGNVSGSILPARDSRELIIVTDHAPKPTFAALEAARSHISAQACYCSLLGQCWLTDFAEVGGRPVKACPVPAGVKPW